MVQEEEVSVEPEGGRSLAFERIEPVSVVFPSFFCKYQQFDLIGIICLLHVQFRNGINGI